jgi:hypothetical protein
MNSQKQRKFFIRMQEPTNYLACKKKMLLVNMYKLRSKLNREVVIPVQRKNSIIIETRECE